MTPLQRLRRKHCDMCQAGAVMIGTRREVWDTCVGGWRQKHYLPSTYFLCYRIDRPAAKHPGRKT